MQWSTDTFLLPDLGLNRQSDDVPSGHREDRAATIKALRLTGVVLVINGVFLPGHERTSFAVRGFRLGYQQIFRVVLVLRHLAGETRCVSLVVKNVRNPGGMHPVRFLVVNSVEDAGVSGINAQDGYTCTLAPHQILPVKDNAEHAPEGRKRFGQAVLQALPAFQRPAFAVHLDIGGQPPGKVARGVGRVIR